MIRGIASGSMALAAIILLGRAAGFLRDVQIGAFYGLSSSADLAIVLLTAPDLLVSLLLAGGLSAALIPEFQRLDSSERSRLFSKLLVVVGGSFSLIALAIALFPELLLAAFAPSYLANPPEAFARAASISSIAIPLAGMVGVTTAYLNSQSKFLIAGAGTIIFNATIIAALAITGSDSIVVLAVAVASAALLRFGSQIIAAWRTLRISPPFASVNTSKGLYSRFATALTASTVLILVPVIVRSVVSTTGDGNLAALSFATKLLDLPVGVVIATISTVAFPLFARFHREGHAEQLSDFHRVTVQRSLAAAFAIAIPAIAFAPQIALAVFGYGRMKSSDVVHVAEMAQIILVSLPFIALGTVSTTVLTARLQTSQVLKLTLLATSVLPFCFIAAKWSGDLRVYVGTLPVFHLVLAIFLAWGAGFRAWGPSGWLDRDLSAKIGISSGLCFFALLVVTKLELQSPYYVTAIALLLMGISLLLSTRSVLTQANGAN